LSESTGAETCPVISLQWQASKMSDPTLHPNLIAKVFENDDALNLAVDGQIVPNFRRAQADSYLSKPHQTCIGIRTIQGITEALPGCFFHGGTKEDQLIEIALINVGTDESYLGAIEAQIKDLLKVGLRITYGGVEYAASISRLIFAPLEDDQAPSDWIQKVGTCRLKYLDS
jgi:hypothetical protein